MELVDQRVAHQRVTVGSHPLGEQPRTRRTEQRETVPPAQAGELLAVVECSPAAGGVGRGLGLGGDAAAPACARGRAPAREALERQGDLARSVGGPALFERGQRLRQRHEAGVVRLARGRQPRPQLRPPLRLPVPAGPGQRPQQEAHREAVVAPQLQHRDLHEPPRGREPALAPLPRRVELAELPQGAGPLELDLDEVVQHHRLEQRVLALVQDRGGAFEQLLAQLPQPPARVDERALDERGAASSSAGPSVPSSSETARVIASSLASIRSASSSFDAWKASAAAVMAGVPSTRQRSSMRSLTAPAWPSPTISACTAPAYQSSTCTTSGHCAASAAASRRSSSSGAGASSVCTASMRWKASSRAVTRAGSASMGGVVAAQRQHERPAAPVWAPPRQPATRRRAR